MPSYLAFDRDVLIFTDQNLSAGGITDGGFPATILTQGAMVVLRDAVFAGGPQAVTPTVDELAERIARSYSGLEVDSARRATEALLVEVPHLAVTDQPPVLGDIEAEDNDEDWQVRLSGRDVPVPAGSLRRRRVGDATVFFSQASRSLSGSVRANPSLGVMAMDATGVRLRMQEGNTSWAPCGGCGTCGLCALCGEVNYAVAALSAAAILGFFPDPVAMKLVAARQNLPPDEAVEQANLDVRQELEQRLRPLLAMANDIADADAGAAAEPGDA